MLQLFDTATGAVHPLIPREDPVSLYVCGITPYDSAHLGHAFTYHVFDIVARRLRAAGLGVRHVRNVTDCDDDIFRVARERGIPHRRLVADQVARFEADMAAIDILPVDSSPYASAHVPAMIDWISRLESAGFAYASAGMVYFDVSRFDRYGRLSGLDPARMAVLSRERGADPDDPRKAHPLDFVLWQPSLPDEMMWDSPWGRGRPGWHIECSVLAAEFHPDGIDLHGGGDDLVYPHHESEIAQYEAVAGHALARHWVHVAMVGLDGVKMSKSLGNLVFVTDLLRTASPGALRLLLGSHHHRTAWTFEAADLDVAVARMRRYRDAAIAGITLDADTAADAEAQFFARLDDDLDTPGALAVLDGVVADAGVGGRGAGPSMGTVMARLLSVIGVSLDAVRSGAAGVSSSAS